MVKHETDYVYTRPDKIKRYTDRVLPIAMFFASLAVYLHTMAPSLFWGTTATFAVKNQNLVMPEYQFHPLYDILGRLVTLIPSVSGAMAANIISALFAACGVMFFSMIIRYLLDIPAVSNEKYKDYLQKRKLLAERPELREGMRDDLDLSPRLIYNLIPNIAVTSLFAIVLPIWLAAVKGDNISLQIALVLGSVLFILIGSGEEKRPKFLYLGIWLYALSFANNPELSLYLSPAYIFAIYRFGKELEIRPRLISATVIFILAGLALQLYYPLRSAYDGAIAANAGEQNLLWPYFLQLLSDLKIQANIFQIDYLLTLKKLGQAILTELGWPILVLLPLGMYGIGKILKSRSLFFAFIFLGMLGYLLTLGIFNPSNSLHLLPMAIMLFAILVTAVVGMIYFLRLTPLDNRVSIFYAVLVASFVYVSGDQNLKFADLATVDGAESIAQNMTDYSDSEAIYLLNSSEIIIPLYYYADREDLDSRIAAIHLGSLNDVRYRQRLIEKYDFVNFPADFGSDGYIANLNATSEFCRLNANSNVYLQPSATGINPKNCKINGVCLKYSPGIDNRPTISQGDIQLGLIENSLNGNRLNYNSVAILGGWLMHLGRYYQSHNQNDVAWKMYYRALDLDRQNIEYRLYLAANLAKTGEYKTALKLVAEALDINSNDRLSLELGKKIVDMMEDDLELAEAGQ